MNENMSACAAPIARQQTKGLTLKEAWDSRRRFRLPGCVWHERQVDGTTRSEFNTTTMAIPFVNAVRTDWEIESDDQRDFREALAFAREAMRTLDRLAHVNGYV